MTDSCPYCGWNIGSGHADSCAHGRDGYLHEGMVHGDVPDSEIEAILDAAVMSPRPRLDQLVTHEQVVKLLHEVQERREQAVIDAKRHDAELAAAHAKALALTEYELEGLRLLVLQLERDALPQGPAVEAYRALKRHLEKR